MVFEKANTINILYLESSSLLMFLTQTSMLVQWRMCNINEEKDFLINTPIKLTSKEKTFNPLMFIFIDARISEDKVNIWGRASPCTRKHYLINIWTNWILLFTKIKQVIFSSEPLLNISHHFFPLDSYVSVIANGVIGQYVKTANLLCINEVDTTHFHEAFVLVPNEILI